MGEGHVTLPARVARVSCHETREKPDGIDVLSTESQVAPELHKIIRGRPTPRASGIHLAGEPRPVGAHVVHHHARHTASAHAEHLFGAMDATNDQQFAGRFPVHCPE